jgi:hypothetical protein
MYKVIDRKGRSHYRVLKQLSLGTLFYLTWEGKKGPSKKVKLIKVTEKGYNFLELETNRCLLYPHLYQVNEKYIKSPLPEGDLLLSINQCLILREVISEN